MLKNSVPRHSDCGSIYNIVVMGFYNIAGTESEVSGHISKESHAKSLQSEIVWGSR
jgi:hypothetical protein